MSAIRNTCIFLSVFVLMNNTRLMAQELKWISFGELQQHYREDPRPILVFIHADWCTYCNMQEETTFRDSTLTKLLNSAVYALKLDAESREDIFFFNRKYVYIPTGNHTGQHQLATFLGNEDGKLTFPTTVLLNERLEMTGKYTGYTDQATLLNEITSRPPISGP